jgi:hypothetical protein
MDFAFDERKLLHPGVHDASMEDVEAAFGRFQRSDRRMKLFAKLTTYVETLKKAIPAANLIVDVDGSFVMKGIDEPSDIDLILILPADWDDAADLKPYQYNLVSKRATRRTYRFDVAIVKAGSEDEAEWLRYFGGVNPKWREKFGWPSDAKKGVLRISL